jgi:hypothetical protein
MTSDELRVKTYLETVYDRCDRDMEQQVSMYAAGEAIGLEKNEAGALAEELMVEGLLELKTLAGNVSLTSEGLAFLGIAAQQGPDRTGVARLGSDAVVNEADLQLLEQLVEGIKKVTCARPMEFALLETVVFDLKTLEVQLLSPRPKTAIIREVLADIRDTLADAQLAEAAEMISSSLG